MARHYRHGSTTQATLNHQRERNENLHHTVFPKIYTHFENNYGHKTEQVPIFSATTRSSSVTLGYYHVDDISDLLTKSGVAEHLVNRFTKDISESSNDGYFGRETFVVRLSKNQKLLAQVVNYCSNKNSLNLTK